MNCFLSKVLVYLIVLPWFNLFGITLPHQGRVSVSGIPFNGTGSFRFALVDQSNNITWNHEGGTGMPSNDLTLEVSRGFYQCNIGDPSVEGMSNLPSSLFDINNPLSLRIWFNDGVNGLQQLDDDQPLHIAPYSLSSPRTGGEIVASQLGESISIQAVNAGTTESDIINRLSTLAQAASPDGKITASTLDSSLISYLTPKLLSPPSLPAQSDGHVYTGQTLALKVEAEGRFLTYQWQKDGVNLHGENNSTFKISEANASIHDGNYSVIITNDFGTVATSGLQISILEVNNSTLGQSFFVRSANDMELSWVPAGSFVMGSPANQWGRDPADEVEHNVSITQGFYLGLFEVTQSQFLSIMKDNQKGISTRPSSFNGDHNPVENVSWNDIESTFLPLLNQKEEAIGNLPYGWSYALPTEAEWEYACRGHTRSAFYWGDNNDTDLANYMESVGNTKRVGCYPPNPWGFYDMHGNVSEWVSDWYDVNYFTDQNITDPVGYQTGTVKIYKGGAFSGQSLGSYTRAAFKGTLYPHEKGSQLGFRLALKRI